MRIKVHCQNRVGILRDILNLLVDYGINVARGEVGGEQGNAIYLHCPNLINLQFQALRPKLENIPGVFGVKRVGLMPSERRHLELNALLGALDFPVLSIDMGGSIVAANRSAAQLLGVRVDEVPGMALSRYIEDFDLPELVRANKSRVNGLRVRVKGDVFLADIAPLQSEHDESEALAGAVLTLHRADRVGERIYNVRKHELRGFDSIFQSSRVMAAVVREARRMAPLDAPLLIEGETGTGKELLARAMHYRSSRADKAFVVENCGALPDQLLEAELFGYKRGAFTGADEDRIGRAPHGLDHVPRLGAGDPAAFTIRHGDASVETGRKLQRHEGPPPHQAAEKTGLQPRGLGCQHVLGQGHAALAQDRMARTTDARVRIGHGRDDARDARRDQPAGAGRRAAMMGAGLQRHIGRGAARGLARHVQRHAFGMGAPAGLGPAAPHDAAIPDDDAAHRRVRPDIAQTPRGKAQGMAHVADVVLGGGHAADYSDAAPGRSSETNLSKSSASWKFL